MSDIGAAENEKLSELRDINREEWRGRRELKKDSILKRKRLKLSEVEQSLQPISLQEFKDLTLSLKKSKVRLEMLRKIRKGTCAGKEHIDQFFRIDGAFKAVISAFLSNDGEKQLEAATIITNLACGTHKSAHKIAKTAGVYLISHMNGGSHFMQDQCTWALGNVAEDCDVCFCVLKDQGLLPALLNLLKSPLPDVIHSAVFCLNACIKYEDSDIIDVIKSDTIETLLKIIQNHKLEQSTLAEACAALTNCCFLAALYDVTTIATEDIAETALKNLENFLTSENVDVCIATSLVRCLGYLCGSTDTACRYIAHSSVFASIVKKTMSCQFYHLKKEILWVLTNILASREVHLDSTIVTSVLERISIFLNLTDSSLIQVLYFLCVLAENEHSALLIKNEVPTQVKFLLSCDKEDILKAVNVLLFVLQSTGSTPSQ